MTIRYEDQDGFLDYDDVDDLEIEENESDDEPWMIDNEEDEVPSYGKNYFPQTSED